MSKSPYSNGSKCQLGSGSEDLLQVVVRAVDQDLVDDDGLELLRDDLLALALEAPVTSLGTLDAIDVDGLELGHHDDLGLAGDVLALDIDEGLLVELTVRQLSDDVRHVAERGTHQTRAGVEVVDALCVLEDTVLALLEHLHQLLHGHAGDQLAVGGEHRMVALEVDGDVADVLARPELDLVTLLVEEGGDGVVLGELGDRGDLDRLGPGHLAQHLEEELRVLLVDLHPLVVDEDHVALLGLTEHLAGDHELVLVELARLELQTVDHVELVGRGIEDRHELAIEIARLELLDLDVGSANHEGEGGNEGERGEGGTHLANSGVAL